ncbi:MAG: hypothetical protein IJ308_00585 [Clostridia bacterium]|nr:hypothetical protein [Clostridia bacterium]
MTKKIKILCLTLCGAAVLGLGAFATVNMQNAGAETELIVPEEYVLAEEYLYGDTLIVPTPSSVSIKSGNTETAAVSVVLRGPDGVAKGEGSYTLDKMGYYELTYYNANGISATQTFVVNKNNYGLGEGASATYVTDLLGETGKTGIDVTLKDGSSFTFNKTVNLNDFAGQELEVCKIFPMFRTSENENPDASTVSVKVVDCYDPTKFVEFYIWCGEAGQGVYYMGAGASTQNFTGLEQNFNRPHEMTEEYNGEFYKIHRPQRYQSKTAWGTGMGCRDNATMLGQDGMTLFWDLENHQIKAKSNSIRLITDIDAPEIYGLNVLDYDTFFTTGEVYLNIEVYNYTKSAFNFGVEKIFGMSGEELQNSKIVDAKAPDVSVGIEATENNTIYLQKGEPVVLPTIERVIDANYYGKTYLEVYRNYGKYGQALLNVENGVFVPDLAGNYTAVYSAVDGYGNEGKFLLDMVVVDEQNIVYTPTALNTMVAAQANVIPYIQASGLNKAVQTTVVVTAPNGEETEVADNGVDGYTYIPTHVGEYTISYIFKDNVYEETYAYTVACEDKNAAIFQKAFAFPSYFIKGASYTIAPVAAYTAGDGQFKENKASVSVSVDGGSYQPLTDAQMEEYKVEANSSIRFKASYGESFIESDLYSVVDVGYGKKTSEKQYLNYWQGNYSSATMLSEGAQYEFDGDGTLQFVNVVSSANFNAKFALQAQSAEKVTFTLRDARDPSGSYVTYTYQTQSATNVTLHVQQYEDNKLVLDRNILTKHKALAGEFTFAYSSLGMTLDDLLVEGVKAFNEDNALLEIVISGATSAASITVSQLNYQTFSKSVRESIPQIVFQTPNGALERNAVYEISPCYGSSVFSTVLAKDVKLTVVAPDGKVAKSVDNVTLENVAADKIYQLKLAQVGQYRIVYEATCLVSTRNGQEGLSNSDYYILNVSEGVAPTVKFKDGSNSQTVVNVKVGSTHDVKAFTVSDNVTAKDNIKVYTMIMAKDFTLEEDGYNVRSYTFKNVGEFIVYVVAYDELGNSSSVYYNVVVTR